MLALRRVLGTTLIVACRQVPPQTMQRTRSRGCFQTQAVTGGVRGLAATHGADAGVAVGAGAQPAVAEYEEVLRATRAGADADSALLLIDVREPLELAKLGHIPTALNIPLGSVAAALGEMSADEFERTYGRSKPTPRTHIVFYCQVGQRSHLAQQQALQLGYTRSKNYLGSYNEWSSKQKS